MISDYNNPYFYQTPPIIKGSNPFVGYQYPPVENVEMKYNLDVCPDQICEYNVPPVPCWSYPPPPCIPNSVYPLLPPPPPPHHPPLLPPLPPDPGRVEYVDSAAPIKYEYHEPEENFISIDELQYNPTLLKMILPDSREDEKSRKRVKPEDKGKAIAEVGKVKIKKEPEESPVGTNEINIKEALAEIVEMPAFGSIKVEKDPCPPDDDLLEQVPVEIQIKTEPTYKFSFLDDSDEEIDENEVGVEFNWMDLEEQEKQEFECRFCGRKVSSNYNLRRHMMIHTDIRPYGCDVCLKTFREFSDLKKHRRSHRGNPNYKCLICRKVPPHDKDGVKCSGCSQKKDSPYGTSHLNELQTIIENGDKKSFICPECNRTFGSRHNLRRHYMIHTGDKPYPCDVCDKSFREVSTLKKHMLTHSRMKLFKCLVCDREYNDYQAFVRHKSSHGDDWVLETEKKRLRVSEECKDNEDGGEVNNDEDYLFECNDCRKRFTDVAQYKRHLRVHSHFFTFQCYICKMTFKKCEKLNSHMVTHSHEISDSE